MMRNIIWIHNTDVITILKDVVYIGRHVIIVSWNKLKYSILVVDECLIWVCYACFIDINS
jgi:hypothetical protein